jgi:hypothetical protein
MRIAALLLALLATSACAGSPSVAPSNGTFRFSGTISAMSDHRLGGPIAGVHLAVVSGVNMNAQVTSDGQGRYEFDNLARGRFTIAIDAPGYVPATPDVLLFRDTEVNFALSPR